MWCETGDISNRAVRNPDIIYLQCIPTGASAEVTNGYHIITCHLELNISQQFGVHKKAFCDSLHNILMSIIFEIPQYRISITSEHRYLQGISKSFGSVIDSIETQSTKSPNFIFCKHIQQIFSVSRFNTMIFSCHHRKILNRLSSHTQTHE